MPFNRRSPRYVKKGYFNKSVSEHKKVLNKFKAKIIPLPKKGKEFNDG